MSQPALDKMIAIADAFDRGAFTGLPILRVLTVALVMLLVLACTPTSTPTTSPTPRPWSTLAADVRGPTPTPPPTATMTAAVQDAAIDQLSAEEDESYHQIVLVQDELATIASFCSNYDISELESRIHRMLNRQSYIFVNA